MRLYQTVIILRPDLDDVQIEENIQKIKSFIIKFGGEIVLLDNWGKKRLAYRIRKNRFGIYLNVCHKLDAKQVDFLEKEFRLAETIIKFLVIRLEAHEFERVCGQTSVFDDLDKKLDSQEDQSEQKNDKEKEAAEEVS